MKKVIAWLLVLALTAAVSIGATLAYLTDTDEDVNVMTLGKVKIDQLEYERTDDESQNENAEVQEFHDNKPLYPAVTENGFDYTPGTSYVDWTQIGKDGYTSDIWDPTKINNEVDKMVFVKNKGTYDAYVRTVFAFEAGNYESLAEFQEMIHLNLNDTDWDWEWTATPVTIGESTYFIATATYNKVLEPGAYTEISLSQISLDKTATNEDVEAFGETYHVLVKSQGIQADGFPDPDTALTEGFGVIDARNVPFDTDQPVQGIDVRSALRFYQGDATAPIHTQITDVVFGLNKEYPEIVDNYTGTLITEEQDVETYSYYVQKDGKYTVYFLANAKVNLPKDSSGLFRDMSALVSIDTHNMDVSGTENMSTMLYNCANLETIDVSHWDTSNVTTMRSGFRGCKKLKLFDVSGWETGNVVDMMGAFQDNHVLESLDVSNWDTSKAQNMGQMFNRCYALSSIDVSDWDVSNVTAMKIMFQECSSLTTLDVGNWDTSSVTSAEGLFNKCTALQSVDVSGWDVSNIVTANQMFQHCASLTELDLSGWKLSKATTVDSMFRRCVSLETLDVSNLDLSNVKDFDAMFCSNSQNTGDMALKELIGIENWNVQSVETMESMFYGCGNLTELDLGGWNVTNLTSVSHAFADCYKLEHVDFTGWNTPKLKILDGMFNDCRVMKTVDLSSFDTSNVTVFGQMFEACKALERVVGLENWDTGKGNDFSEMFSGCGSLTELDLSSFDTQNAYSTAQTYPNVDNLVFLRFLSGCTKLEKITFGPYFDFDGVGNCPDGYKFAMPSASNVEGWDGHWYDAEGNAYLPSEIPEMTARTYYAVNPVNP